MIMVGGGKMTILVVEDDNNIQELLCEFLQEEKYVTKSAKDGIEACALFSQSSIDLVLLDIMLPKINGYKVCEFIRQQSNVPIIAISALSGEEDQILAFDLKIDDYITKPFSMPLLLKKIEALLRRTKSCECKNTNLIYKNIIINTEAYKTYINDREIELTHKEFELLKLLIENAGRVLTRNNLVECLWNSDVFIDERVVDTHIKNLRKKLSVDYIKTVRGVGYTVDKIN